MKHVQSSLVVLWVSLLSIAIWIGDAGQATAAGEGFAGRWDLTIRDSNGLEMPSWLELSLENKTWNANFVGRWGNSRRLPEVSVEGGKVKFVSPKQEEGSKNDLVFEGNLADGQLKGAAKGPNGADWTWTGKRAPTLKRPGQLEWGKPLTLFDGHSFAGWRFDNPKKASSWSVENSCLVNKSAGSNIATERKFQDFKLHVEVNCPTNANSGIYLRGRYEVQVEDDSIPEPPSHHMGAVYGFLAPVPEQPRRPGVWQSFDITLVGRYVTVSQNGQVIIDNKEIPGITGGAFDSHEELPGPIYFQGDHGGITYRNIILTPAMP